MDYESLLVIFVCLAVLAALLIPPGPGSPLPDRAGSQRG
jgi:hypothetical protein